MPEQYLLLTMTDHQLASLELQRHGGSMGQYVRCLNRAGRWAIHGSPATPLLVWPASEPEKAQAAAKRAAEARRRPIAVITRSNSAWVEGRDIQFFSESLASVLEGYVPHSEGKARRLQIELEKLEANCQVVQAASTAVGPQELAAVSRAAAQALRAKFGGGSMTSAIAWLAGRAGRDALVSVLAGEVEPSGVLSIEQIIAAADLAQKAEAIRAEASSRVNA